MLACCTQDRADQSSQAPDDTSAFPASICMKRESRMKRRRGNPSRLEGPKTIRKPSRGPDLAEFSRQYQAGPDSSRERNHRTSSIAHTCSVWRQTAPQIDGASCPRHQHPQCDANVAGAQEWSGEFSWGEPGGGAALGAVLNDSYRCGFWTQRRSSGSGMETAACGDISKHASRYCRSE